MSATTDLPALLSIPQLADLLDCAPSTLYGQLKVGTFDWPTERVGADIRVPRDAVLLRLSGVAGELGRIEAKVDALTTEVAALRRLLAGVFAAAASPAADK